MINFIKKIIWFLTDKCNECGGHVSAWSYKKAYCDECGAQN